MNAIRAIVNGIDAFSEWCGRILCWLLILVGLSCYEVFTRRILGKPTIWTHEILGFVFAGVTLLVIGYTQKHRAHVNVDFLYQRLSPKGQALFDIISFFFFLGLFCYVYLIDGIEFARTSWAMHERTPSAFNVIVYPAKTLIPVAASLLTIQALSDLIKNVVLLVKGEKL